MNKKSFFVLLGLNVFFALLISFCFYSSLENNFQKYKTGLDFLVGSSSQDYSLFQDKFIGAIQQSSRSVVSIFADKSTNYNIEDDQGKSLGTTQKDAKVGGGSGIICSKKGYIITNKHVVEDTTAHYTVALSDGSIWNVDKIWFDDELDLAFLHISDKYGKYPSNLPVAEFIPFGKVVRIGQLVFGIGNVLGEYINTTTLGIISGKYRKLTIGGTNSLYAGLYQTDAAINPGNSGGPLVDLDGKIIGIITAIARGGNNIGFALPLNQSLIDATLVGLDTSKTIVRPLLGIDYTDTISGTLVTSVFVDTPAYAQLFSGDIILALNHNNISPDLPFLYQLYSYTPGTSLIFTIMREGKNIQIPIVLGKKSK